MAIRTRPRDMPEVRAELAAFAGSDEGANYWALHASTVDYYSSIGADGSFLANVVRGALGGELFSVSGPMGELAAAAGQSLHLLGTEAQDFPARSGLLIFEKPPQLLRGLDEDGVPMTIYGAAWSVGEDEEGGYAWITPVAEVRNHDELLLGGPRLLPFSMAEQVPPMSRQKGLFDHLVTTLRSAWLLMQQPLAENTEVQPDRAARKRLRRIGSEPAAVRLIELRRPKSTGTGQGNGDGDYHHQWIVRGHWRQQWYPARQVHRPIWIAPHVKGPEGAPLIGGEKVNVLRR